MILRRFYDDGLAQASYLVACQATGEALVVDPNREVRRYLDAAAAEGVRITHVTETHVHADFVSGARELAALAGARLLLSGEGDAGAGYAYGREEGATLLHDGDTFRVGRIRIEVLHTPGHTPEHLSFLVTDCAGADQPMGLLTGDFVFVGDVGRPDLLEKAVRVEGSADAGARALFRSLERFRGLPDWLQLWPGHGAGSACGKALGAVPQSTVGYEKRFNPAFAQPDEASFVAWVLAGQPEPPRYFAQMKRINRQGPAPREGIPPPPELPAPELDAAVAAGEMVVDTRPAAAFAARHVPGTINVPLNRSFTTWAGWLLPYDRPFRLIVEPGRMEEATRVLSLIGMDCLAGWFPSSAVDERAGELQSTPQIGMRELEARLGRGEVTVLDVRSRSEFDAGHLPGALNLPVGELPGRLDEVPTGRPLVVQCQGGARSAIAASILQARGFGDLANYPGGYAEWSADGLPTERAAELEPVPA